MAFLTVFAVVIGKPTANSAEIPKAFQGDTPTEDEVWNLFLTYARKIGGPLATRGPSVRFGKERWINHGTLLGALEEVTDVIDSNDPTDTRILTWMQSPVAYVRFVGLSIAQLRAGFGWSATFREDDARERIATEAEIAYWKEGLAFAAKKREEAKKHTKKKDGTASTEKKESKPEPETKQGVPEP